MHWTYDDVQNVPNDVYLVLVEMLSSESNS